MRAVTKTSKLFKLRKWLLAALTLLPAVLFQNCQQSDTKVTSYKPQIANEADQFLNDFIANGAKRNVDLSATNLSIMILSEASFKSFLKVRDDTILEIIGYCYFEPEFSTDGQITNEHPTVLVNEAKWITLKEYQKKELIYHELGHCMLHRVHSKKVIYTDAAAVANTQNLSIMNPIMLSMFLSEADYQNYVEELQDELFNGRQNTEVKTSVFSVQKGMRFGYSEEHGCEEF
jgi:hypothetical protein